MKTQKKIVKTFLAALLVLGIATSASCNQSASQDQLTSIKEKGTLVLGTSPDFPPFEFYVVNDKGDKEIVGSDIALAKAIAEKIGVELEIKATDFNGVLANIQSGQVDIGISGFAMTEARKAVMQFSEGYNRSSDEGFQGILTKKAIAEKYTDLESLKTANLLVGAQSGSIQLETAAKITGSDKIKQLATLDALALALEAGDIDAVAVSTDSALPLLSSFTDFVILDQDAFDLDPEQMYSTNVVAFPKGEGYESLINLVNEAIEEARSKGDLDKWVLDAQKLGQYAVE